MKKMKEVLEKVYSSRELRKTIVPLFIGNPGLGKTVILNQFAKEKGIKVVEFITSQRNPFEISGMAMPNRKNEKMEIWDFDEMDSLKDGDILFFDEVLNGNPTVLNACLTLLESRKMISGKSLPDIMVVAAANPQGMVPITPQIKERFVWYDVNYNSKMWRDFMRNKYGMPFEISIKLSKHIEREDFSGYNFYTPRSVDKAVSCIIRDVPTPYEGIVKPALETPIKNPLEATVKLSEDRELGENEMISWLELIKLNMKKK